MLTLSVTAFGGLLRTLPPTSVQEEEAERPPRAWGTCRPLSLSASLVTLRSQEAAAKPALGRGDLDPRGTYLSWPRHVIVTVRPVVAPRCPLRLVVRPHGKGFHAPRRSAKMMVSARRVGAVPAQASGSDTVASVPF